MNHTGTSRGTTTTTTSSSSCTTSSSSTTTTTTTNDQDLQELYMITIGSRPSQLVLRQMSDWVQLTSMDVLQYALEEAACAPAPSWRYALAILRDCQGLHVTAKPGQSIRVAVETARGYRYYQQSQRRRLQFSDDETITPYYE